MFSRASRPLSHCPLTPSYQDIFRLRSAHLTISLGLYNRSQAFSPTPYRCNLPAMTGAEKGLGLANGSSTAPPAAVGRSDDSNDSTQRPQAKTDEEDYYPTPTSAYYFGPPDGSHAFGERVTGKPGVHLPKEIVRYVALPSHSFALILRISLLIVLTCTPFTLSFLFGLFVVWACGGSGLNETIHPANCLNTIPHSHSNWKVVSRQQRFRKSSTTSMLFLSTLTIRPVHGWITR